MLGLKKNYENNVKMDALFTKIPPKTLFTFTTRSVYKRKKRAGVDYALRHGEKYKKCKRLMV